MIHPVEKIHQSCLNWIYTCISVFIILTYRMKEAIVKFTAKYRLFHELSGNEANQYVYVFKGQ